MCNTPSPFNGNISVTDCMPLSSLIKTSKINGCVKCRWCEKIAILDDYQVLPSITAGVSRVINIRMVQYSLYHTSVTRHWASVYHTNRGCQRQTVQKKHFWPTYLDTPKHIAIKSGQTHFWDRTIPSCKISHWSAQDNCPRLKIHIFPYRGHPWGLPNHAIHF